MAQARAKHVPKGHQLLRQGNDPSVSHPTSARTGRPTDRLTAGPFRILPNNEITYDNTRNNIRLNLSPFIADVDKAEIPGNDVRGTVCQSNKILHRYRSWRTPFFVIIRSKSNTARTCNCTADTRGETAVQIVVCF